MEKDGFIKKVIDSFIKTHKEINLETEELDARYRWLKYFVEEVLGYSGNEYHIEKSRADITIFDEQKRAVIKIETKRPRPLTRESVESQALKYAEPGITKYIGATNFIKFWLWERTNVGFALKVDLDFDAILKQNSRKFNINTISPSDKGNILYLENLKKEFIYSSEKYQDFNTYYASINISNEEGFQELLKQLHRIVNELLMSFALRAFDQYFYGYNEYKTKISEIDKKIKQSSDKEIIQKLEREKERLKQEYSDFRDFGFDAWLGYSGRDPEKFDENKEVFCKETIYVLLNKLLFVRICEDRGLFKKKKISNGGIEQLREFIENSSEQYKQIMNLAFKDARHIYNHFYEPGILDWYTTGDGELDKVLNKVLWLLNQFDFKNVGRDILGKLYEKYLPKEERKALGEFYTPDEVIEYILDGVKYTSKDELFEKDLIDPACGSGGFLVKAINRYIEKYVYKLGKSDRSELTPQQSKEILESVINHIYGLDINPFACHIAEMNLLFQIIDLFELVRRKYPDYKLPRFKIYQTDSLKLPSNQKDLVAFSSGKFESYAKEHEEVDSIKNKEFDFVVGNPPYVRVQFLPLETVTYWKKHYKVAHKRCDIYVPFYERGIKFLKEGGKLGYITSDQYLVREYGQELRRYLLENMNILQIIDFKDVEVFQDITIYTLVFLAEKSNKRGSFLCVTAKRKQEKFLDSIRENLTKKRLSHQAYELFRVEQNGLSEKNWTLVSEDSKSVFDHLQKIKDGNLGDENITEVLTGTYGGYDKCFMVKILGEESKGLVKIRNQDNREYIVEKEVLVKIFRGKDVKKWTNNWFGWYIFYPYYSQNGKTVCYKEEELRNKYPNTYSYFKLYHNELSNRMDSRKKISELGRPWFSLNRPGIFRMKEEVKIMTPCVTNKNNFTLDIDNHLWVVGTNYGIFPKNINHKFLLGILNSSVIEFYLKNKAPVKAGGYYQYMGNILKDIPIKIPNTSAEKQIEQSIISVVDEILELTKKYGYNRDLAIEFDKLIKQFDTVKLVKSPLVEKISLSAYNITELRKSKNKLFINLTDFIETKDESVINYLRKYIAIHNLEQEEKDILKIISDIPVPVSKKDIEKLLEALQLLEKGLGGNPDKINKLEDKLNRLVIKLYKLEDYEDLINNFLNK
ncbi:MAG: N-6 DNA methylase [Nanoarchaeota archaeon]|nr:N-6 DNA methylase [Nanoarchaeota archaeon]MBU1321759.1 N-6 DNA methylase [Nanoarchaeota archaeon]MBU1597494.1 N-6 DNA methylase [Nanoarchaeota archaeon]MBU2441528.1 N-6 DNA methylase [Nanoarchaeota archaeon]